MAKENKIAEPLKVDRSTVNEAGDNRRAKPRSDQCLP